MDDVIAEYRALRERSEKAAVEVVRAEERLDAAKKAAAEVAARAKEMGFDSVEALRSRKAELEQELARAIEDAQEVVE